MKKVTVDDLAQKLGVSKSTISRALNGSARISAKTREAVQKLAYEMGYYENAFSAAELANPLPANIGVCLADLNNPFSIQIIKGVQDTCARYGYNLILADSDMDEAREVRNIQNFLQMGVKGMVIHAAFADTHEKAVSYTHLPPRCRSGPDGGTRARRRVRRCRCRCRTAPRRACGPPRPCWSSGSRAFAAPRPRPPRRGRPRSRRC